MTKPKIALVGVACHFESGGERAGNLVKNAEIKLKQSGLEVERCSKIVWDAADALEAVDQFIKTDPDLLVILHSTWVLDSLQYIFINNMDCPVVLWGVPYTETFSIGCVQHFASILHEHGIVYKYVYGLPEDKDLTNKISSFASVASIYKNLKNSRIALIGPRQTWRVAGSQDMTYEEWDMSKTFGVTIVHIEMDELLDLAEEQTDEAAVKVLEDLKKNKRIGVVEVEEERMLYAAKVYLGLKELYNKYGLTAAAAECYPNYSGLVNLPSSWLADDGLVLDTEGDIAHTLLMTVLNQLRPGATALGEVGSIEDDKLYLSHEGSTAHSLAENATKVHILPGGDNGTVVGLPVKPMPEVTITNLCGTGGSFRMFILKGSVEAATEEEWVEGGSKFYAKVNVGSDALKVFEKMLTEGVDHHLLVKEGDLVAQLEDFCELFKTETVTIK